MIARFRRVARRLGRRERVTKRLCFTFLGLAVLGFAAMLVAPGGPSGTIGVIACVLAFLSVVFAILAMIVWAFCGTLAEVSSRIDWHVNSGVFVTPRVAHTNLSGPADSMAAFNRVLVERSIEPADFADPGHVLAKLEWAKSIRELSLEEANLIWGVVVEATHTTTKDPDLWSTMETAAGLVGGGVARLRLERGTVPAALDPDMRNRVGKTRFGAIEMSVLNLVPIHERVISVLGGLTVIAFIASKLFLFPPGSSGPGRPPTPAWYWLLLSAVALLALLRYGLRVFRHRRARGWAIRGTANGICVESSRYAGRVIEVPADRCWVFVQPLPKNVGAASSHYGWLFHLPEHPHALWSDTFHPAGTPWEAWLEEWREAASGESQPG